MNPLSAAQNSSYISTYNNYMLNPNVYLNAVPSMNSSSMAGYPKMN